MNSAFLAPFLLISLTSSPSPLSLLPPTRLVPPTDPSRPLIDSSTYQPRYNSKGYPKHTQRIPQGYNLHFVQNLAKMPHLLYNTLVLYTFCIVFDLFRPKSNFREPAFYLCLSYCIFVFLCSITYFTEKMHKFYEKMQKLLHISKKCCNFVPDL